MRSIGTWPWVYVLIYWLALALVATALLMWDGSVPDSLASLVFFGTPLGGALTAVRALSQVPLERWHGGQLVTVCIGATLAMLIALWAIAMIGSDLSPVGVLIALALAGAAPAAGLVASWRWFGGRTGR